MTVRVVTRVVSVLRSAFTRAQVGSSVAQG